MKNSGRATSNTERHPSWPTGGALGTAALMSAFLVTLGGCATSARYNPEHLAPSDHVQVAGLCSNVVGLRPGIEQFDACLEALSASVRDEAQRKTLTRSQADCLRQQPPLAGPALAECELDDARARSEPRTVQAVLSDAAPLQSPPTRSYWAASNAEVHRREETACARLGLEPVGGAFAQCVASLDAALFAASNPSQ